jgi:hypothetical protein
MIGFVITGGFGLHFGLDRFCVMQHLFGRAGVGCAEYTDTPGGNRRLEECPASAGQVICWFLHTSSEQMKLYGNYLVA